MEREKPKPLRRTPHVLSKINTENLHMIERGLLGDLPEKLRPNYIPVPVRGRRTDVVVAKSSSFLSSCIPVVPDSPGTPTTPSDDEVSASPLKKSFSFRDRFSRISIFGKDKEKPEKPKWKPIVEDEIKVEPKLPEFKKTTSAYKSDHDYKVNKRFWFFRNKEMIETRGRHTPVYKRSKSFEFMPRALEEDEEDLEHQYQNIHTPGSFGSRGTMGDAWASNDSLDYLPNNDNDDGVFMKTFKGVSSSGSSNPNSSMSTVNSASSVTVPIIMKGDSMQNLLEEFDKAVEMFSENYLSDNEPYTKSDTRDLPVKEKRKSSSFRVLKSPKIVPVTKADEISEDFRKELSKVLSEKRASVMALRSPRRGSVTDWFVLEDKAATQQAPHEAKASIEANKYRRAQKKPVNRVRRISSTKYVSTDLGFVIKY